jgi:predicted metal-dependent hydrolase
MEATERSCVQYGRTRIEYAVLRSTRRGTVSIGIELDGTVLLRAPATTPITRLDTVVHRKAAWIVRQVRDVDLFAPLPTPREFVRGESFLYLGKQYRLAVGDVEAVRLRGGELVAPTANRRECLAEWFANKAQSYIRMRAADVAARMSIDCPPILVRDQEKRWGSCSASGEVRVNWRIVQAAPRLIDYVLTHEFVHLRYRRHGREFWAAVGTSLPDYESAREALRLLGPQLVW